MADVARRPRQLGDLRDMLKPGMATIILRTPLGIQIVDPFAEPDPTVDRIRKALGIEIEFKLGPPTTDDLAQPQLSTGLLALLAVGGFIAYKAYKNHCLGNRRG